MGNGRCRLHGGRSLPGGVGHPASSTGFLGQDGAAIERELVQIEHWDRLLAWLADAPTDEAVAVSESLGRSAESLARAMTIPDAPAVSSCGAKTRSGEPCRRHPAKGRRRCRLHGGATPRGAASANFRNGKRSPYHQAHLAALRRGMRGERVRHAAEALATLKRLPAPILRAFDAKGRRALLIGLRERAALHGRNLILQPEGYAQRQAAAVEALEAAQLLAAAGGLRAIPLDEPEPLGAIQADEPGGQERSKVRGAG